MRIRRRVGYSPWWVEGVSGRRYIENDSVSYVREEKRVYADGRRRVGLL